MTLRECVAKYRVDTKVAENPWLDGESAPKDGTAIVAIGRGILRGEGWGQIDPFVAAILWLKDQSGYEGWHFVRDGMCVARELDEEVIVDWWLPVPTGYAEGHG